MDSEIKKYQTNGACWTHYILGKQSSTEKKLSWSTTCSTKIDENRDVKETNTAPPRLITEWQHRLCRRPLRENLQYEWLPREMGIVEI